MVQKQQEFLLVKRIVIIGAGFAGVWSALSATRLLDKHTIGPDQIEVTVVAPRASLDLRPRFYEANVAEMTAPVGALFEAAGVRFVAGTVEVIDAKGKAIEYVDPSGTHVRLAYDRLVLASGSRVVRPAIPGLSDYAFSIDQLDEASQFEAHLRSLAGRQDSLARNTAIVVGGGFTGIEIATELPARMQSILGEGAQVRVIVIERADAIGPELGAGPRPVIVEALASQGVECRLSTSVEEIDAGGVRTTTGERIDSLSVVWTGGMRASALTEQINCQRDAIGRLLVDADLRVASAPEIFATGDTARARTDASGNYTLMSCQHALGLGRFSGNNAAADLLGIPTLPYTQERYATCLDLGPWGSVVTSGWDRVVQLSGAEAKQRKRYINSTVIMPPSPVREEALAAADPSLARNPTSVQARA
ncbi:NAD(P)/FAD-dependent oxidoreductase [Bradyrhizobium tropiciagri]|uniref:NAD(P)/FAD-dependent oxidoreductase n=1 Tax=Bradyrhizobium tropiciagri TaxID=312253 RepID=UPI00067AF815|nr:FAD-dependent oxidoreductase [Bradyrhizobium tropiciagri]